RHDRNCRPDRWQRGETGRHSFRGVKFGESTDAVREVLFSNRSRNVQTTSRPARVRFTAEGAVAAGLGGAQASHTEAATGAPRAAIFLVSRSETAATSPVTPQAEPRSECRL